MPAVAARCLWARGWGLGFGGDIGCVTRVAQAARPLQQCVCPDDKCVRISFRTLEQL